MSEDVKEKSWDEFRSTGLLWFTNMILHVFGWAIVVEKDVDKNLVRAYPARVRYRGFSETSNEKGYINVTNYLKKNIKDIAKDLDNEED